MTNLKGFKTNISLKNFCSIKTGGTSKYLMEAKTVAMLQQGYGLCKTHNIKCKVIGLGANLIFSDKGFNGAIIVNKTAKIIRRKNCIYATSGCTMGYVIGYAKQHGLGGVEKLAGIPATLGGAVVNNLGAFGCEIANYVDYVVCMNPSGKVFKLKNKDCKFEYRGSIFKSLDCVILKVKLNLTPLQKEIIANNISQVIAKKVATQPLNYPSAGSVFKRCNIIPAKVIDNLGLKGFCVGGMQISNKHAGFIVNVASGSSADYKKLVFHIQKMVKENYNITLKPEVEFVDF